MPYLKLFKKLNNAFITMVMAFSFITLSANVQADDNVTLVCKKINTDEAVDFSSLALTVSSAVPVGTVVYSGSFTVNFQCALDDYMQYKDHLVGEVYFKRKVIDEGTLGYGLTIYTGYGGEMSGEAASIATGNSIATYALTAGGTVGVYTDVTLTVPFEIVRTSTSMTSSTSLRNYVNVFDVGSYAAGTDLKYIFTNIKTGITVKDETCSVAGNINKSVPLGSYSVSKSSGLGSGIGQSSNMIPFDIQLNCESLLSGSFDVMMQLDGDAVSGLSDIGVIALNSSSTASGVGVQILNESQQPVALATPFNVASYPLSAALVTVPLYARYYQIMESVGAGSANAVATYTISYQ
ncbi:MAG: fimbrial protein [Erwinia billingiae]|uniref:fimbrial protein n=1 Tax=Erwinia billingiae TaxID=182337 RepID=UPI00069EF6D5|nr:fimbrial protein [Erwinia billingiae]